MPFGRLCFYTRETFSRLLMYLPPTSHPRETPSKIAQYERSGVVSCHLGVADQLQSLPPGIDSSAMINIGTRPECLVENVQRFRPFLPDRCGFFGPENLKIVGSYPFDAGGFADLWMGERNDGAIVAIKSLRCYSSLSCLPAYVKLYKEASTYSLLNDNDDTVVSFIGIYSTVEHPLALVFEFMSKSNLREFLRNNRNIPRVELLLEVARGLKYLHSLGIVHGNLKITNILVDGAGHVRIAGFGTVSIPHTMPGVDVDRSFHGAAPDLIVPRRRGSVDPRATMAGDVHSFAVLAWEVFAAQSPISNQNVIAGIHSTLSGHRLARPTHPELSSRMWKLIKESWKSNPARRKTMAEVVAVLEAEVNARMVR